MSRRPCRPRPGRCTREHRHHPRGSYSFSGPLTIPSCATRRSPRRWRRLVCDGQAVLDARSTDARRAVPRRAFAVRSDAAFTAAHRFTEAFDLAGAEPDLPSDLFPEANPDQGFVPEDVSGFPLECFVDGEPALPPTWAIDAIGAPAAWGFSAANQRPDRGRGIIVAQPDTGVVPHLELATINSVPGFDVLDGDADP